MNEIQRLLKKVKVELKPAQDLFRKLDMNQDGIIDVNELGDSVASFYLGKFDEDERLWVRISKKSYVNQNDFLASMPNHQGELGQILGCLNFEGTENVTLWQFIRAKGQAFRKTLDNIISKNKIEIVEGSGAHMAPQGGEEDSDSKTHESTIMDIDFDENNKPPLSDAEMAKIPRAKVIIKKPPQPKLEDLPIEKLGPPPDHPLYEVFTSYLASLKPKFEKGTQTDPVNITTKKGGKKAKKYSNNRNQLKKAVPFSSARKIPGGSTINIQGLRKIDYTSRQSSQNRQIKTVKAPNKFISKKTKKSKKKITSPMTKKQRAARNSTNNQQYVYSPTRQTFGDNTSVYNSPNRYATQSQAYARSNEASPTRYTRNSHNPSNLNNFKFYPKTNRSQNGQQTPSSSKMTKSMIGKSTKNHLIKTSPKRVVISGDNTTKWKVEDNKPSYYQSENVNMSKDRYGMSKSTVMGGNGQGRYTSGMGNSGVYRPDASTYY